MMSSEAQRQSAEADKRKNDPLEEKCRYRERGRVTESVCVRECGVKRV